MNWNNLIFVLKKIFYNFKLDEPFYYKERVDVISRKFMCVLDAEILSIRGPIIQVRYFTNGEEENILADDRLIIKQCK